MGHKRNLNTVIGVVAPPGKQVTKLTLNKQQLLDYGFLSGAATWQVQSLGSVSLVDLANSVAIGSTDAPHAGVGLAKLAIEGTDGSALGPHIQLTTATDNHPLVQVLAWTHDNMNIAFDSYWDGANDVSSSPTGNFRIRKSNDLFMFDYDSGIAAGSPLTWNTAMTINTSGRVGIGTVAPEMPLEVLYPFAKTDVSAREVLRLRSNDVSNWNEMLVTVIGNAAAASRTWRFQTGEDNVSNSGWLSLQPFGGNVVVGDNTGFGTVTSIEDIDTGSHTSNFTAAAPGSAQGQRVGISFYPTFEGTGDNGQRRAADIVSGFDGGAWGNQYLAFHVGDVTNNDAALLSNNAEKMRLDAGGHLDIPNQPRACLVRNTNFGSTGQFIVFTNGTVSENITRKGFTLSGGRLTVPSGGDGTYFVHASLYLTSTTSGVGNHRLSVFKNGVENHFVFCDVHLSVDPVERSVSVMMDLVGGDIIDIRVDSSTTSTLTAQAGCTWNVWKVA